MVRLAAAGIGSVRRLSSFSCRLSLDARIAAFAAVVVWVCLAVSAFAAVMVWVYLAVSIVSFYLSIPFIRDPTRSQSHAK